MQAGHVAAAIAPVMPRPHDPRCNRCACRRERCRPARRRRVSCASFHVAALSMPHQRRMEHKAAVHAEIERELHRLHGVVAAIRIAGEICLAHTGDDVLGAAPIGQRGARRSRNTRLRPGTNVFGRPFFCIAISVSRVSAVSLICAEHAEIDHVVLAKAHRPRRAAATGSPSGPSAAHPSRCDGVGHSRSRPSPHRQSARAPTPDRRSSPVRRRTGRARGLRGCSFLREASRRSAR